MNNAIKTIHQEFRRSAETRYIHRLHGVLLVLSGLSTVKAGKLLEVPQRTVAHWMIQFKKHGLDGLRDAEKSGRSKILNSQQKQTLMAALAKSPRDAGLNADTWTNVLVLSYLNKTCGIECQLRSCSRLLKEFRSQPKP
jgi:transposase